ncbi:MAG TPA: DUF4390 domain-containing protein [Gammaproteobacteria bacterium]|nr:DUF4390 domain-containing protein [Gammaproteobacteria bacterium]
MRACANSKRLLQFLLLGSLCIYSGLAASQGETETQQAERFVVQRAETSVVNDVYVLNAEIDYRFNDEVLEALENGVPLTLEVDIEILRPRQWMWNETFTSLRQRYRLLYHALTQQYLVKNINSDIQYNFPTQQAAITALGTITDLPLLDKRLLEPGEQYLARMRANLDLESLPTPLRLLAYLSPQWHLDSEWFTWPLQS